MEVRFLISLYNVHINVLEFNIYNLYINQFDLNNCAIKYWQFFKDSTVFYFSIHAYDLSLINIIHILINLLQLFYQFKWSDDFDSFM